MTIPLINRELSWLEFNQRVLNEADRFDLPVLERIKFLAITDSNLDEFYQVRVGGKIREIEETHADDPSLNEDKRVLKAICDRAVKFQQDQSELLNLEIIPLLKKNNYPLLTIAELNDTQLAAAEQYFEKSVLPHIVVKPLVDNENDPVPYLKLSFACSVSQTASPKPTYYYFTLPFKSPRFIPVAPAGHILLEDLIHCFCDRIFPDHLLKDHLQFRLTRNGDIPVNEYDTSYLADEMRAMLVAREDASAVRIQVRSAQSTELVNAVLDACGTPPAGLIKSDCPIQLSDFMELALMPEMGHLRRASWTPQASPEIDPDRSIFDHLQEKDILLFHPYQSFDPVVRFLREAAKDPQTKSIQQTLYRVASGSCIVDALLDAAKAGKRVIVLVEIKARFDEARNLKRASDLQEAGATVLFGVTGLKTHAKMCLITREENGKYTSYVHLGTGNYNESTAKLYCDISYLTARSDYTKDAQSLFNYICHQESNPKFQTLIHAPKSMRPALLGFIEKEAKNAKAGVKAQIMAKMNSLEDEEIIHALYAAAEAGVTIRLNVRGICCLKTGGYPGSENITVISIIDRYLEHSRIFSFHNAGDPKIFISSADWMTRNLDRRIELMTPIIDDESHRQLTYLLKSCFKDNTQASKILADGTNQHLSPLEGNSPFRLQLHLQQRAETQGS